MRQDAGHSTVHTEGCVVAQTLSDNPRICPLTYGLVSRPGLVEERRSVITSNNVVNSRFVCVVNCVILGENSAPNIFLDSQNQGNLKISNKFCTSEH